jgi:hypothetical protein
MSRHAQVVIAAPDGDLALTSIAEDFGVRRVLGKPVDRLEDAVAVVAALAFDTVRKEALVVKRLAAPLAELGTERGVLAIMALDMCGDE